MFLRIKDTILLSINRGIFMDLLYFLQNIRNNCPGWFNLALMMISESVIILAPLFVTCFYWAVDKKKGTYMICAMLLALFMNEILKVTVCIYRPWVLDSRIVPAAEVLHTATNYSFPSSHSCTSAAAVTSMIFAYPGRKKCAVCGIVFVLLVMLSRMYLGCHTLKDVCCGAAVGVCTSLLFRPMLSETFNEDRFTKFLLPVSLGLTVISILYITNKSYPLDYDAAGNLLVDPAHMCPDAIGMTGCVTGLGLGLFYERKCIFFSMSESRGKGILRILLGAAVLGLLYFLFLKNLIADLPRAASKFILFSVGVFFICGGYPAILKTIVQKKSSR